MIARRGFLLACAAAAACRRTREEPSKPERATGLDVRRLALPASFSDQACCTVVAPKGASGLPVLVALHGMGETWSPDRGARGWLDFYALDRALDRLAHPPLVAADFEGFVTPARLAALDDALAKRPFGGLVVVCPWVPASVGHDVPLADYARWLGDLVLPRVRRELGARDVAGIDGVSFGGITALRIGLARPDLFRTIGALQPAIHEGDVDALASTIAEQRGARPLHLVTSTGDVFRPAIEALHAALDARGVAHDFLLTEGPHDYAWNRGPGAIEMLLWQSRALGA